MSTAPTVGRIVHYRSYGTPGGEYEPECRAALVTAVGAWVDVAFYANEEPGFRTVTQNWHPDCLALSVHNPTGIFLNERVHHDESRERGGTWHWPCVRSET